MAEEMIYRPREMYEKQLEKQYHEAALEYFNNLVKEANVDENMNAMHVKTYNEKVAARKECEKKLGKAQAGKGWAIVGLVLGAVTAVAFLVLCITGVVPWWGYFIMAGGLLIVALMIVLLCTVIKNAVKRAQEALDKAKAEEQKALQICYDDLAVLNSLYDWNMPQKIMTKATPILKLDDHFTSERDYELHQYYGLEDDNSSTLDVVSGSIMDNPFVLEKVLQREIKDKEYHGTLTISWTTTSRDSNGNVHTEHHTQTLHASAWHPAPFFTEFTRLIYGNEAAPDLVFSRYPNENSSLPEAKLKSYVKKRAKELAKKERKALTDNDETTNFQAMGNDEFDALFGADDRNHEVQFRLLFTALAQVNMVDLMKNPYPYGDDFAFFKDHKINSVASRHSQTFDYVADPAYFRGYDVKACRENFVAYCDKFLRGLYFDLAPLLSVPLYQMHRPVHSFYESGKGDWLPRREHEVLVNGMRRDAFIPQNADPSVRLYLKQTYNRRGDGVDLTTVRSSSFHTTEMIDYVPVMGGDGHMHNVPVHWIQYDEVWEDFQIVSTKVGGTNRSYNSILSQIGDRYGSVNHYERGLLAFAAPFDKTNYSGEEISKLFPKQD